MKKVLKIVLGMSFILYIFVLIEILFLSARGYGGYGISFSDYIRYSTNMIPFKTIGIYIKALFDGSMNLNIPLRNLGGNLLLFLPMGIYLPFLIKKADSTKVYCITMVIILFGVELIQLITRRGSFDVDDFILNMIGALIGFVIWRSKLVQKICS